MADIYAPLRAGRTSPSSAASSTTSSTMSAGRTDPFFQTWLLHYTNAATIISGDYRDAEESDGVFSGLMEYKAGVPEWPYNGFVGQYDAGAGSTRARRPPIRGGWRGRRSPARCPG